MCSYITIILFSLCFHSSYCLNYRGSSCPRMYNRAYEGYIPKGNETAGTYNFIENSTDLEDCISKCCDNKTCNVVVMFNEKCYIVDCESDEMCVPTLHHNTNIRENVTMVLVKPDRKKESWENILKSQELWNWKDYCPKMYEFTYTGYLPKGNASAGNFSFIEEITDIKNCVLRCCNDDKCNVAIINEQKCYNVECKSSELCIPVLYHNATLRKYFSMVLVKPVVRQEKWKDNLIKFKGPLDEENSESNGETTVTPINLFQTKTEEKASDITFRLSSFDPIMNGKASSKTLNFSLTQMEGPTNLEFHQINRTVFDIKRLITGNYIIKLSANDEDKSGNLEELGITENVSKKEPITTTDMNSYNQTI